MQLLLCVGTMGWRINLYSSCTRLQMLQPRFIEIFSILQLTEINGVHSLINRYAFSLFNTPSSDNQFYFCMHIPSFSPWGFLRSSFRLALERNTWDWNPISSWDALSFLLDTSSSLISSRRNTGFVLWDCDMNQNTGKGDHWEIPSWNGCMICCSYNARMQKGW